MRNSLAHLFPFLGISLILHSLLLLLTVADGKQSNQTKPKPFNVDIQYIYSNTSSASHLPSQSSRARKQHDNLQQPPGLKATAPSSAPKIILGDPERYYEYSELDTPPQPESLINPEYPLTAKESGVTGELKLALWIDQNGMLIKTEIIKSVPAGVFDETTLKAFDSVHFIPGYIAGRAVKSRVEITIKFKAQE